MSSAISVIVPPASGRRETVAVLLAALIVVLSATGFIALHRDTATATSLPHWQVDLRSGLNAAEQGLTADLLLAADEMPYLDQVTPEALAAEGLPPFFADATATARGGHHWQLIETTDAQGWLGQPAAKEVAGAMLMRIAGETPTIWLHRDGAASTSALDDAALIAAGWRQVITRFDASVTRKDDQH
ncbi:hypothetical protein JJJ17_14430 [Paracoccus caeni]|uniref:Uncharacterized protein n=1 Tax=Paracoccus caeni TaxID=657651 RepID=A0A934W0N3_9RHOB|nr:DUF6162 family protein [Paracoccus caeni]MBK4217125.1 hypothetical protein [Paracoccus caeni]